jgi:hypothetical protein
MRASMVFPLGSLQHACQAQLVRVELVVTGQQWGSQARRVQVKKSKMGIKVLYGCWQHITM